MWSTPFLFASFNLVHALTNKVIFDVLHAVQGTWSPNTTISSVQSIEICKLHCLRFSNCYLFALNETSKECKLNKLSGTILNTVANPESELIYFVKEGVKEMIALFGRKESFDFDPDAISQDAATNIPLEPQDLNSDPYIFNYKGGILKCGGVQSWNIQLTTCYFAYPGTWNWVRVGDMNKRCGRGGSGWLLGNPWITGGSEVSVSHKKTIVLKNGVWEFGPDLPTAGLHHTLIELSPTRVLVIGIFYFAGYHPMTANPETFLYDALNNEWSVFAYLTNPRPGMAVAKVDLDDTTSIVVAVGGGGKPGYPPSDEVNILDLAQGVWKKAPFPFPVTIFSGKVIVIGNGRRLLHLGGSMQRGEGSINHTYEYVHNGPWKRLPDLLFPLGQFGVAAYNVYT